MNSNSTEPERDRSETAAANRRIGWACAAEVALVVLACGLAWFFEIPLGQLINPTGRQAVALALGVGATLPMFLFLIWMLRTDWPPVTGLRDQAQAMVTRLVAGASPAMVLAIAVLAGLGEEMLFRGAIQPLLGQWLTPWGGVVAAGLLFGLAHPMSRAYIVVATIGGLYLGALAQLTGEILSATVAHALYDVLALRWLCSTADGSNSDN